MASVRARFTAHADGVASNTLTVPLSLGWTLSTGVFEVDTSSLSSGDNTYTVPTGATMLVIIPATNNTTALKIKGNAGDTGVTISPSKPTILGLNTGTVILNAGGALSGVSRWWLG